MRRGVGAWCVVLCVNAACEEPIPPAASSTSEHSLDVSSALAAASSAPLASSTLSSNVGPEHSDPSATQMLRYAASCTSTMKSLVAHADWQRVVNDPNSLGVRFPT